MLRRWYVERFLRLRETALPRPASPTSTAIAVDHRARRRGRIAEGLWTRINLRQPAREHPADAAARALILTKGEDLHPSRWRSGGSDRPATRLWAAHLWTYPAKVRTMRSYPLRSQIAAFHAIDRALAGEPHASPARSAVYRLQRNGTSSRKDFDPSDLLLKHGKGGVIDAIGDRSGTRASGRSAWIPPTKDVSPHTTQHRFYPRRRKRHRSSVGSGRTTRSSSTSSPNERAS